MPTHTGQAWERSQPSTLEAGGSVTINTTIYDDGETQQRPTGSVRIFDGTQLVAVGAVVDGQLSAAISNLSAGAHNLWIVYEGDGRFSTSELNLNLDVAKVQTTSSLTASATSVTQGQAVTLTASVQGSAPTIGGRVNFSLARSGSARQK